MVHKPRLSKTRSWVALQDATARLDDDVRLNCQKNPERYQDLPDELTYNPLALGNLCGDCPLFFECQEYGRADRGATGVWGGIQHKNDRIESGTRKKEV